MTGGRVLHYVPCWLRRSEGFVAAQIGGSARPGTVVARARDRAGAPAGTHALSVAALCREDGARQRWLTAALCALATVRRVDMVHVHFGYYLHEVDGLLRRRPRPVVVSLFGHDVTAIPRLYPELYRDRLPRVDAVLVPSRYLAERAVEVGAPADRIEVVPPGVDRSLFRPEPLPDDDIVVFVGRFVEKKGLRTLVEAWPAVRRSRPKARLRLVGYGPLRALVERAGDGVEVVGPGDHALVRDEIARARVVVTPSETAPDGDAESQLLVNLEAQATGRPVVTTRHGGIPEFVVEDETAVLVAERDASALAEALLTVLGDRALAERLGAAGPAVAARFDVATSGRIVDLVYDRVGGTP